jgi:hypothetical protein
MDPASNSDEKPVTRTNFERAKHGCYTAPWCTICLVTAAITCHGLVLAGNLATAKTFSTLGHSTGGWSDVGIGVSDSLTMEISADMALTTKLLAMALGKAVHLEEEIDMLLGSTGNKTQHAMKKHKESLLAQQVVLQKSNKSQSGKLDATQLLAKGDIEGATLVIDESKVKAATLNDPVADTISGEIGSVKDVLKKEVKVMVESVMKGVKEFFEMIKPALEQVGKWLHSMGAKMQGFIEQFSTTIDRAQKMFDQVMSKVAGGANKTLHDKLVYHTFHIFDVSHTGTIGVQDVHDVAAMYNVAALAGPKGKQLHDKHDENGDGQLSKEEYSHFVADPSLPSVMTYTLRCFAKKLSAIAGVLKDAKKRDEVADSLANYLTLMTAKNLSKVAWVSQTLTNGSVPMDLSIDVLRVLADKVNAPDRLTDLDSGEIIVTAMMREHPEYVTEVLKKMSSPALWESQGWDENDEPKTVKQVTKWVKKAAKKVKDENSFKQKLMEIFSESGDESENLEDDFEQLEELAFKKAVKSQQIHHNAKLQEKIRKHEMIFYADSTSEYYQHLLGSREMASASSDPDVTRVVQGGVEAHPSTLKFAARLVNNATACSQKFQHYAFDYVKTSSNQIDSFANGIQALIKKVQNFLHLMMKYSTKRGIDELEKKFESFAEHALGDVHKVVDHLLDKVAGEGSSTAAPAISGAWKEVKFLLKTLKGILPTVVDNIKFAQNEVSQVASTLDSIFSVFKVKGSPLFENVSALYRMVWIGYFSLFCTLTTLVLLFGFWSEGWCRCPEYESTAPVGCMAKCKHYCCNCLECIKYCSSTHMCLWSCLLLAQFVILLIFIVSILFTILAGLKAFISVGCAQIYVLGDDQVCTSILTGLRGWMATFWTMMPSKLDSACEVRTLTACKVITKTMIESALYTVAGSFAAAIVSMQMLFQFAHTHERATWMSIRKDMEEQGLLDKED